MQEAVKKSSENPRFTPAQLLQFAGLEYSRKVFRFQPRKRYSAWNLFQSEHKQDFQAEPDGPKRKAGPGRPQLSGSYAKGLKARYADRKEEYQEKARKLNAASMDFEVCRKSQRKGMDELKRLVSPRIRPPHTITRHWAILTYLS